MPIKQIEFLRNRKFRPETIEKMRQSALNKSSETRKKMSEARKGKTWEEIFGYEKAQEMKRQKSLRMQYVQLGKNNPTYKDGKQCNYGINRRIAIKNAKEHYEWKCHICGQEDNRFELIVHHINQDRNDNFFLNLLVCCRKCHMLIHNAIRYPRKEFEPSKMNSGMKVVMV